MTEFKGPWANAQKPLDPTHNWHSWYVWYPRLITDEALGITAIMWLETVERRKVNGRWEHRIAR
mgnify:CR=1 FL=1